MNNLDITQTGYLTGDELKTLNEQQYLNNMESLKKYQEEQWDSYMKQKLDTWQNPAKAIYDRRYSHTYTGDMSQELLNAGYGTSKYDKNLTSFDQLNNLNELRAQNQRGIDKIANSVVNAAVVAGTTAVETALGTPVGLLNAVGNLIVGNVNSIGEFINYGLNNPVSNTLRKIEEEFSDRFMNYKTAEYTNEEWYKHILSADFIGDAFIQTLGYAAGAIMGSVGVAKVASKALRVEAMRDIFEGAALEAGQTGSKAKDLWQAYMQGKPVQGTEVTKALAEAAKKYENRSLATRAVATVAGGLGEARPIAQDAGKRFYEENAGLLKEQASYDIGMIKESIYQEHPEWFEGVQAIPENALTPESIKNLQESNFKPVLKEEYIEAYNKLYGEKQQIIKDKYTNLLLELEKEKIKHENTTYALVAGITTGLNATQLGKAVAGGMSQQQGLKNVILNQEGLGFLANEAADKAALRAARFRAFGSVASEGVEEGLQDIVPKTSDIYFGDNINELRRENSFYSQGLYQKGLNASSTYIGDLVNATIGTITNPEEWESAVIGSVFGFLPMGGIGRSKHINKEGKVEKGKLELRGEFWESLREAKQAKQGSKAAAESLNKVLQDPKYKDYVSALIRHQYYADEMNSGLANNDAKLFKDAEYKDLINTAMLFAEHGQLDYFKRLVDRNYSIETEQDVEELKQLLKSKDGDNIDFFKDKSAEEVIDYYKRTKEKIFKDLSSFEKIQENLNTLYGDMPKEFRQELIFDIANIDNREQRIEELSKKLNEFITKNTEYFENKGVEVSKLKKSITDSRLGEIIAFFEQQNPELVSELFEGTTKLSEKGNKEKRDNIINYIAEKTNHIENYDKNTKNLENEVITLKDRLTEIQKVKNKKSDKKYLEDKKEIEKKLKNLQKRVEHRKKYSEEYQNDIEVLKESLENLKTQAIKSDVSFQDLKDLIRLVGERDLLLKKFKYLANNPKIFEDFQSEKLNKAINTFYKKRAEQYYSQLKNDFDTNIIFDNALKVETLIQLAKEKDNKTLQAKLEAFTKYIQILTHPKTQLDENNNDCNSLFDIIYHLLRTNDFQTVEEYDTYIKGYLKDLNVEIKDPETDQIFPNIINIKIGNNDSLIVITDGILQFRDIFISELDSFNNTDTVNKETQESNVQDVSESLFDQGETVEENGEPSNISEDIDDALLGEFFGSEEPSDNTEEQEVEEIEIVNTEEPEEVVSEPEIIPTEESDTSEQSSDQNNQETTLEPTSEDVPQLELQEELETPEEDIENTQQIGTLNVEVSNLQPIESPVPLEITTDSPINLNTTIYDIDALKRGKIQEKTNLRITEKLLKSLGTFKLIDSGLLQQAFQKTPDMPVLPIKLGLVDKNNQRLYSTFFAVEISYFKDFNIPDSYNIKTVKVVSKDGEIKEVFVIGVLNEPINVVSADNRYTDKRQSKRAKDIANQQFFTENEKQAINNIDNYEFPAYHQHDSLGNPIETRIEHVFSGRLQYTDRTYPLKNLVQEANEETVDVGYFKNGKFISIDNKVLKNNEIEVLPNDNNGNLYQRDGSVWIRVKEADGRYYFKPLYVNKFDSRYIVNSPKDSIVIKQVRSLAEQIHKNVKEEKYKEAKKYSNLLEKLFQDLHIYKDKNNKFYINAKNGSRFVINGSIYKDFLQFILDQGYVVNITNKIFSDSKSLIHSNILDANVSSLHNVGASVLISPIYIEDGVYRYQQTAIGKGLKEGKIIHLGNTDSGYQRESKQSTDGSYRIIDGKYQKRQILKQGTKWKEITSDSGKRLIDFIIAKDNNEIESSGFTFDNGVEIELFEYKNNYFTNSKNGAEQISKKQYIQYMQKIKQMQETKLNGSEVSKINNELENVENTFVSEIPIETIQEPKQTTVEVLANQDNNTETQTTPQPTQNIQQTPQRIVRNTGTGGNTVMRLPKIANNVFNRYNSTFERDEKIIYTSDRNVKQKLMKLYESNSDVLYDLELMEDVEFKQKLKDLLDNTCI